MPRLLPWTLTAAAFASAGCADNDSGMFVRAVLAVQAPDCVATADPSAPMLLGGVLDIGIAPGTGYMAALLVGNQLVRRGDRDKLRTETARVSLEGAEVTVLTDTGEQIAEYSVPGTGFVDPGSSDEPGYGILSAMILPPNAASSGTVVTKVRVFGTTLGGDEIESATLTFPIVICSNCLVSNPVLPGEQGNPPCRPGQDDYVDCAFLPAGHPGCPAPVSP
jgi:hypothetical protein